MPDSDASSTFLPATLRVATYNIHKGVQGLGVARRLEIHNLGLAVEQLDADIVCLQEVRKLNRREEAYFSRWPEMPQAEFLAPEGYEAIYRTNAYTKDGEHGNAMLSRWPVLNVRHEDMSDHRFEQRGLLHSEVGVQGLGQSLHVLVVHLGLIRASRVRQAEQLDAYIRREIPADAPLIVAGDFNDWGERVHRLFAAMGLKTFEPARHPTFPAMLPLVQLDYIYARGGTRGLKALSVEVPRGKAWRRMSDHLPLIVEFAVEPAA